MSSIVFSQESKTRFGQRTLLAAGLSWVVLDTKPGKPSKKNAKTHSQRGAIRKILVRNAASGYVQNKHAAQLGLYSEPMSKKVGSGTVYSVAIGLLAALTRLNQTQASTVNAVLLMQPQSNGQNDKANATKRLVVIIQAGSILLDAVLEKEKALSEVEKFLATGLNIRLFCEHADEIKNHPVESMDWANLLAIVQTNAAQAHLRNRPLPTWLVPVAAATVLVVGASTAYYYAVMQPAQKRALAAQLSKLDNTPAYVVAVDQELSNAGWDRENLITNLDALRAQPLFVRGWALEQVRCTLSNCTYKFTRKAGVASELAAAMPQAQLDLAASNLDTTVLVQTITASPAKWTRDKLQIQAKTLEELRPVLQKLMNVGISVTVGETQKWAGVDLNGVMQQSVLVATPVELVLPLHKSKEVLLALPQSLLVKDVALNLSGDIKLNIKGSVYAHQ